MAEDLCGFPPFVFVPSFFKEALFSLLFAETDSDARRFVCWLSIG